MTDFRLTVDRSGADYTDHPVRPETPDVVSDPYPDRRPPPIRHLVLVLHGILSISDRWMDWDAHVERGGYVDIEIIVRPVSYTMIGPLSLFTGIGRARRAELVAARIRRAIEETPHDQVSIHCHSNGTKVYTALPGALQETFRWVFFAGSICHPDDDQTIASPERDVVNDCGVHDPFPILATAVMPWRFGHTGVVGFHNTPFHDRFFPYGHSRATGVGHFGEHLVPILRTDRVGPGGLQACPRSRLYAPFLVRLLAGIGLVGWWIVP